MLVALGATCTSAISNPAPPLDADCANAGVKPIAVSAAQASITLDIVWKYRTLRAQRKPRGGFAALLVSTNRIDAVALESEFFWAPKRYSFEPNRPKPPLFCVCCQPEGSQFESAWGAKRFPVRSSLRPFRLTTERHLLAQMSRTVRLSRHGSVHGCYPVGPSGRRLSLSQFRVAILVNGPVQNAGILSRTAVNQKRIARSVRHSAVWIPGLPAFELDFQ